MSNNESQTIFKALEGNNFVQISHEIAQSTTLTAAARGVILLMLSMPNNWEFHQTWLTEQFPDVGRDKMKKIIKELVLAGYIRKINYRDENGRIKGKKWFVYGSAQPVETVDNSQKHGVCKKCPCASCRAAFPTVSRGENHRQTEKPTDGKSATTNKHDLKNKKDLTNPKFQAVDNLPPQPELTPQNLPNRSEPTKTRPFKKPGRQNKPPIVRFEKPRGQINHNYTPAPNQNECLNRLKSLVGKKTNLSDSKEGET